MRFLTFLAVGLVGACVVPPESSEIGPDSSQAYAEANARLAQSNPAEGIEVAVARAPRERPADVTPAVLAPATCPSGMVAVGTGVARFCIDNVARTSAMYDTARRTCANAGLFMCTDDQWGESVGTFSVSCGSAWEWTATTDHAHTGNGYLKVVRGGNGNCRTKSWAWNGQHNNGPDQAYPYRCCIGDEAFNH